ncbi:MAG: hypothetical protein KME60_31170 [Cyanomargarita calcarea GSE-NOS-MK-12-04C]|jgi:hypothetical protein|uniref:Uncharacterized protein n=1 Tax=Cyanomargarita calcarea GSE-NOS-MK-12-04C TaxID=2839659 RepID=A0A951QTD6_9CYAN|nr:hypothetical protein [Cyanomargarita calcarea GSE-NOS-MK-12-04C]
MDSKVYAPNIHLFAFYLKDNPNPTVVNDDEKNNYSEDNNDWLWQKCDNIIEKTLDKKIEIKQYLDLEKDINRPCVELVNLDIKNSNLLDNDFLVIDSVNGKINLGRGKDFIYPIRTYKSYALALSLYRLEEQKASKINVNEVRSLNPDNCFILHEQESDSFVGQTLLITAHLSAEDREKDLNSLKEIADRCLEAIFPENYKAPPFNQVGQLFGSPIFEYGIFRQLTSYHHTLVWFFLDEESENKFHTCYKELFDLFFFRAKVVSAYKRSCKNAKKAAIAKYEEIESHIKQFLQPREHLRLDESDLQKFNEQLIILPRMALQYADKLRDIEVKQNTIIDHSRNYTEKLQEIRSRFSDESLEFLAIFGEKTCCYFQEQVTADLGYFHHGFGLIDKAIASIRGQVAIELAERERDRQEVLETSAQGEKERDRDLQVTILAVGSGIGAGQIASTLSSTSPLPTLTVGPKKYQEYVSAIVYSFIFGIIFGILVGFLIRGWDILLQRIKQRKPRKLHIPVSETNSGLQGTEKVG